MSLLWPPNHDPRPPRGEKRLSRPPWRSRSVAPGWASSLGAERLNQSNSFNKGIHNNHRHTYTLTHTWLNQSNSFNKGVHNNHRHTYTLTRTWLNQSNSFNKGIHNNHPRTYTLTRSHTHTHTHTHTRAQKEWHNHLNSITISKGM